MALADSRWQRCTMLCAMYVAQGVPWGFMQITLPAYLAEEYELDDAQLGILIGVILLPWSFKLIWAPFMEIATIRSMGRRRAWIIGAELMMALTLFGMLGLGNLSQNFELLIGMYFLHNVFASMQDVCTDALAVDILPAGEQGQMNGLMWGSKLVGKGVGATTLAVVLGNYGLPACVLIQVILLLGIMLFPLLMLERKGEKRFPWSAGQAAEAAQSIRNPVNVLKELFRAYALTTTLVYIVFAVTKLIGMGINEIVKNTLYIQKLGWDAEEFSSLSGMGVILPQLGGAVLGGILADRLGRRTILVAGYGGFAVLAMTFAALPSMWHEKWFASTYVLLGEGLLAAGSVGFLAMAMRISWTTAAATVFTVYMTLSNVGHVLGNWLAGPVRNLFVDPRADEATDMLSYELTFWMVGALTLSTLLLLPLVRTQEVDEARNAEAKDQDIQPNHVQYPAQQG